MILNDLLNQRQYLLRRKDISRKGEIIRVAGINQIIFSSQCRQFFIHFIRDDITQCRTGRCSLRQTSAYTS